MFEPDGKEVFLPAASRNGSDLSRQSNAVMGRSEKYILVADLIRAPFRCTRLLALCLAATLSGVLLAAFLLPPKYEGRMKFLVKHERVDPVVTTDSNGTRMASSGAVTEEEINSEAALMRSSDIFLSVVTACGLDAPQGRWWDSLLGGAAEIPEVRKAAAVRHLASTLKVESPRKSTLIEVSYASAHPQVSVCVLRNLADLYLAKHMVVNRPKGEFEFFQQQAEIYKRRLDDAEARLAEFGRRGAVAPKLERDLLLKRIDDLDYSLAQTRAASAATDERIRAMESQLSAVPARLETQMRVSDNPQLQEKLKTTLLNLTLKRTELASKFEPSYLPVRELDAQIAQTQAAIDEENRRPVSETTTDQNPTHQWLTGELAKARSEAPMLLASIAATERAKREYSSKVLAMDEKGYVQEDLARAVKAEEQNYLLYRQKQEEARIADALDSRRISNVVLAEAPATPLLPEGSRAMMILVGGLLAVIFSLGCAFAADYLRPTFPTGEDVRTYLEIPVLAAIPGPVSRPDIPGPRGLGEADRAP